MRKYVPTVLVLLLVVLLVTPLLGCDGDAAKAREYLENADSHAPTEEEAEEFSKPIEEVLSNVSAGTATVADIESALDIMDSFIPRLEDSAAKSKAEYDKVLALEDVEDYKEYAKIEKQVVDNTLGMLDATRKFLEASAEDLRSAGEVSQETMKEYEESMTKLAQEGDELNRKAETLLNEKGLF